MYVKMLYMWRITSTFSDIYLHTSKITCLGFVIISWESLFSRFSRDGEMFYRMILGGGNGMSTSSEGGCLRFFVEKYESLVSLLRVGLSSEKERGCLRCRRGGVIYGFIDSNLLYSLSIYSCSLSFSVTTRGDWDVNDKGEYFPMSTYRG